ncbi:hypothetical protein [Bradyrhizobium sp. USDA 3364]
MFLPGLAAVALLYYAGHGIQLRGTNDLVPVSANPVREADVDFPMVDVGLLLRQMPAQVATADPPATVIPQQPSLPPPSASPPTPNVALIDQAGKR